MSFSTCGFQRDVVDSGFRRMEFVLFWFGLMIYLGKRKKEEVFTYKREYEEADWNAC